MEAGEWRCSSGWQLHGRSSRHGSLCSTSPTPRTILSKQLMNCLKQPHCFAKINGGAVTKTQDYQLREALHLRCIQILCKRLDWLKWQCVASFLNTSIYINIYIYKIIHSGLYNNSTLIICRKKTIYQLNTNCRQHILIQIKGIVQQKIQKIQSFTHR